MHPVGGNASTFARARVSTPAQPASAPLFSAHSHRGLFVPARKADRTWRLAVVGDSMVFGHGLPYSRTLSQRLASHLNGALPEWHVEGISLGICGACLFDALGRATQQALELAPDVLIVAACCNDAYMLRVQPETSEGVGQTWVAFRRQIEHSVTRFAAAMRARGQKAALLYLDPHPTYGSVSPARVLREVGEANGLPVIDGSEVLSSYAPDAVKVSVADHHLNAMANDVVARHVARVLTELGWLPESRPFSHPAWIDTIRELPARLIAHGVPSVAAHAHALATLDAKWHDRRNRFRGALAPAYHQLRDAILNDSGDALSRLAWSAAGRWLHERHAPEPPLAFAEARLHQLGAAAQAIDLAAPTGIVDQDLSDLSHLIRDDDTASAAMLIETVGVIRGRIAAAHLSLSSIVAAMPMSADDSAADLMTLRTFFERLRRLLAAVDRSAMLLSDCAARSGPAASPALARLLGYADRTLRHSVDRIAPWVESMPWTHIATTLDTWFPAGPMIALELVVAAAPGRETWLLVIGVQSHYPSYHESQIHAENLIRDGKPHTYRVELPLTLLGTISLRFSNLGSRAHDPAALHVYPATISAPGLPPRTVRDRLVCTGRSAGIAEFAYRSLLLLEDPSCPPPL